jgi:glycosyltransferase involved in cell wall biosynthesis
LRLVRQASAADVVFIQKKRLPAWQLAWMKRRGARLVYDIDDAVMYRSSRHGDKSSATRRKKFDTSIRAADLVVAGNSYLAGIIQEHNPSVVVQPLPFDLAKYPPRSDYALREGVILGWIGGRKSLPFLADLAPVLRRLAGRHARLRLKVVCSEFPRIEGVPVIEKPWSEADEGPDVRSFDIGLAPLPDDVWARGKCGTKLLQYFCGAVPAVASPVGVHNELIAHGVRGWLASSHDEWEEAIERLIRDESLRAATGRAGRQYAEAHHRLETLAARLDQALRSVARGDPVGAVARGGAQAR